MNPLCKAEARTSVLKQIGSEIKKIRPGGWIILGIFGVALFSYVIFVGRVRTDGLIKAYGPSQTNVLVRK